MGTDTPRCGLQTGGAKAGVGLGDRHRLRTRSTSEGTDYPLPLPRLSALMDKRVIDTAITRLCRLASSASGDPAEDRGAAQTPCLKKNEDCFLGIHSYSKLKCKDA